MRREPDDTTVDLTIQEVARRTGLRTPTLRYYEQIGLIAAVPRDETSGHRRYPPGVVERIESLAHLRAAGLSIEAMRTLMATGGHRPEAVATKVELLEGHRRHVQEQIDALLARRDYLDNRIGYWRARLAGDEPAATAWEGAAADLIERLGVQA